jgi:hypothetical protein
MTEGLFILTIIFVAYVVYVAVNEHKTTAKSQEPKAKPEAPKVAVVQPKPEAPKVAVVQPVPEVAAKKDKPATIKPAIIKKTTPAATVQEIVKKGLRDPKTGEVATFYSNYRFTKRWIKDALVSEGLLDKVYKNTELDVATEAAIKEALVKLEAMDKYRA